MAQMAQIALMAQMANDSTSIANVLLLEKNAYYYRARTVVHHLRKYSEFRGVISQWIRGFRRIPRIGLSWDISAIPVNTKKMGESTTESAGVFLKRPEKSAACKTSLHITLVFCLSIF